MNTSVWGDFQICISVPLNKNINFNKNEMKTKINPTRSFRAISLVLQLILESHSKRKAVMSWSLLKKKMRIFCTLYFNRRKFFKHLYFISMYSVFNKHLYFISMYSVFNTFSEYKYLYVLKIITSCTCF